MLLFIQLKTLYELGLLYKKEKFNDTQVYFS